MKRSFIAIALLLTLMGTGFTFGGWRSQIAEGNKQLQNGNTESAIAAYQQGLVDAPDEPVIHYDLGNALYTKGDIVGAKDHYAKTMELSKNTQLAKQAEYNLGNTSYREGVGLVEANPTEAIDCYEKALQHYQNVIKADSSDQNAKFNYEFVKKKLEELKDQLQNQEQNEQSNENKNDQQEQEDQNNNQQQNQNDQQEQNREETQDEQSKEDQEGQEKEQDERENQQQSSDEEEAAENQSAADAKETEGDTQEELQGLTPAQALQLLEQFEDQVGDWIPVPVETNEDQRPRKNW